MFNKPKVGEKIILIGCDGERCESTIVEICKPDAFSLFVVQDGDGIEFWVNSMERLPCGCVVSNEWSSFSVSSGMKLAELNKTIDEFNELHSGKKWPSYSLKIQRSGGEK